MTVILINPNSTSAMTESALAAARKTAPEIDFEGWTSTEGPPAIEGPEDGDRAVPPLLKLVEKASEAGAEVIIIACFDDTGLAEAQALASCPVIGIGQAAYVLASLVSGSTAVVTTVHAAVPVIEANIRSQGHAAQITTVRAANVPVLMLEDDPTTAAAAFEATVRTLPGDTANVILGCAGAVSITAILQDRLALNIMDGATSAARLCKALVQS